MSVYIFEQATGRWLTHDGAVITIGYSGKGEGKNNPAMQNVACVGPIPCGMYHIAPAAFDSSIHGPHCLRLLPSSANQMFGRSGFLIHGDSKEHPGCASEGCIILPRSVRDEISASGNSSVLVTSGANAQKAVDAEAA